MGDAVTRASHNALIVGERERRVASAADGWGAPLGLPTLIAALVAVGATIGLAVSPLAAYAQPGACVLPGHGPSGPCAVSMSDGATDPTPPAPTSTTTVVPVPAIGAPAGSNFGTVVSSPGPGVPIGPSSISGASAPSSASPAPSPASGAPAASSPAVVPVTSSPVTAVPVSSPKIRPAAVDYLTPLVAPVSGGGIVVGSYMLGLILLGMLLVSLSGLVRRRPATEVDRT